VSGGDQSPQVKVNQFMALFAKYRPGFKTFEDAMVEVTGNGACDPGVPLPDSTSDDERDEIPGEDQ